MHSRQRNGDVSLIAGRTAELNDTVVRVSGIDAIGADRAAIGTGVSTLDIGLLKVKTMVLLPVPLPSSLRHSILGVPLNGRLMSYGVPL
jgi:hypothetical protein